MKKIFENPKLEILNLIPVDVITGSKIDDIDGDPSDSDVESTVFDDGE